MGTGRRTGRGTGRRPGTATDGASDGAPDGAPDVAPDTPGTASDTPSTRFQRRDVTDDDVARARADAGRLRALRALGLTPSAIGRATGMKVGAIEAVLADEAPDPAVPDGTRGVGDESTEDLVRRLLDGERPSRDPDGTGGSGWTHDAVPPTGPGSGWDTRISSVGASIGAQLANLGAKPGTIRYVISRLEAVGYSDYDQIERIVGDTHPDPWIPHAIVSWLRERNTDDSGRTSRPAAAVAEPDPLREAIKQRRVDLALQLEEKWAREQIMGSPAAPPGLSEREKNLEQQLAQLNQRLVSFERDAAVSQAVGPLHERLRALESHQAHRTLDDISVDSAGAKAQIQYQAATQAIGELADRAKTTPHILTKIDRVADMALASPGFQNRIRESFAEPGDLTGTIVEQSPEEMARAADQLERLAARARTAPDAVGTTTPKRTAWIPGEERPGGDDVRPVVPNTESGA